MRHTTMIKQTADLLKTPDSGSSSLILMNFRERERERKGREREREREREEREREVHNPCHQRSPTDREFITKIHVYNLCNFEVYIKTKCSELLGQF